MIDSIFKEQLCLLIITCGDCFALGGGECKLVVFDDIRIPGLTFSSTEADPDAGLTGEFTTFSFDFEDPVFGVMPFPSGEPLSFS